MLDFLQSLENETNYDKLVNLFIEGKNLKILDMNTRVLFMSFMLKKFFESEISPELFESSKKISQLMLENQFEKVRDEGEYETFFKLFKQWRVKDISGLVGEITSASSQLADMKVSGDDDQLDDAEKQWNAGLALNTNMMDTAKNVLEIYGKSPPTK